MRLNILVGVILTFVIVSGCASSGTMVTEKQTSAFMKGVTTRHEVIEKLGSPQQSTKLSDGTKIDIYVHVSTSVNASTLIPVVGLLAGGAKSDNNTVTITYTPDEKLKSISSTSGQTEVHTGLLNQ